VGKKRHIIIGAGTAALCALKQIRKLKQEDEIKIITMEMHQPYSPTALPYIVSGKVRPSDVSLVKEDFFKKLRADFIKGKKVVKVDTKNCEVIFENHEKESYDSILIATGSEPVVPDIPGLKDGYFLTLRSLDDAQVLADNIKEGKRAIILGAGLIGMHIAQCLAERNMLVSVVEALPSVLSAYFDDSASMLIKRVMEKNGVACMTEKKASYIEWDNRMAHVHFEDGGAVSGDLLFVAVGVRPRTDLVKESGIKINGGILVDDEMRTNIPNVFAAGDVASAKGFLTGEHGINPILPNAYEQGRVAGSSIAGEKLLYDGWIPMNTFSFFGNVAISVGTPFSNDGDDIYVKQIESVNAYQRIVCRDDNLVGVTFINTEVNAGVFNYLIKKRVPLGAYRKSLIELPRETSLYLMQQSEKRDTISLEE